MQMILVDLKLLNVLYLQFLSLLFQDEFLLQNWGILS